MNGRNRNPENANPSVERVNRIMSFAGGVGRELNLAHRLELLLAGGRVAQLGADQLLGRLAGLALAEAEELGLGSAGGVGHGHLREGGSVSFQGHGHRALDAVQLDVRQDVAVRIRVEADKVAPFAGGVDVIGHDLAVGHLGQPVEDLGSGGARTLCDVEVVDGVGADDGELGVRDPAPEDGLLVDGRRHELGGGTQVKNLQSGIKSLVTLVFARLL